MALCGPSVSDICPLCPWCRYLPLCPHPGGVPGSEISPHSVPCVGYLPTLSPVGGVPRSGASPILSPVGGVPGSRASPHSVPSWRCPWVWGISPFCPQCQISPRSVPVGGHTVRIVYRLSFRISLPRQPECRCLKGHHGPHSRVQWVIRKCSIANSEKTLLE